MHNINKEFILRQDADLFMADGIAFFTKEIKLPETPCEGTVIEEKLHDISFVIKKIIIGITYDGKYEKTVLIADTIRGFGGTNTEDAIEILMKRFDNWEKDIPSSWIKHLKNGNLPDRTITHK